MRALSGGPMKFSLFLTAVFFSGAVFSADKPAELNLEVAQKMAAAVTACGVKNSWKLSVAIVNAEGNLLYFQRGDGTYTGSIDAAIDKAKSASAFQRSTKAFADGIKDGRTGLVTVKNVVGIEGGLPIQLGGKHAGGIGVSGARSVEDEQCAAAALE